MESRDEARVQEDSQRPLETVPTGDMVEDLLEELSKLACERAHHLRPRVASAGRDGVAAALLGTVGGALALVGSIILCFDAVYLLAHLMPLWVSALIVGGGAALAGGVLAFGGLREGRKLVSSTTELAAALEEDARWARQMIREARRNRRGDA